MPTKLTKAELKVVKQQTDLEVSKSRQRTNRALVIYYHLGHRLSDREIYNLTAIKLATIRAIIKRLETTPILEVLFGRN